MLKRHKRFSSLHNETSITQAEQQVDKATTQLIMERKNNSKETRTTTNNNTKQKYSHSYSTRNVLAHSAKVSFALPQASRWFFQIRALHVIDWNCVFACCACCVCAFECVFQIDQGPFVQPTLSQMSRSPPSPHTKHVSSLSVCECSRVCALFVCICVCVCACSCVGVQLTKLLYRADF